MIKTLLFSDASLRARTVCLITRMTALRRTMMRKIKSSKTMRWTCVVLITTNNSWMRGTQNVWTRIKHLSIFLKWLMELRILCLIFSICLLLQITSMKQQEIWRCTKMIWCHKNTSILLKMAISKIFPPLITVINLIFSKTFCLNRISRSIGYHIKSAT
jgi:hypothetical protein